MYVFYVNDDEVRKRLSIGELLDSYGEVFIGRLGDEDLEQLRRMEKGITLDYLSWGLFLFTYSNH